MSQHDRLRALQDSAGARLGCAAPRVRLDAEPLLEALLRCARCAWEGRFSELKRQGSACPVCGSKHVDRARRSGT
ncbi:MAG: hypothetical protein KIT58_00075 [Planctomycetota bacterium]|nr:hypothetical protein [Planctomycetota bacterium]